MRSKDTENDTDQSNFVSQDKPSQMQQVVKTSTKLPISWDASQYTPTSISVRLQADLRQSGAKGIAYARYHAKNSQDNYLEHYIASSGDVEALGSRRASYE